VGAGAGSGGAEQNARGHGAGVPREAPEADEARGNQREVQDVRRTGPPRLGNRASQNTNGKRQGETVRIQDCLSIFIFDCNGGLFLLFRLRSGVAGGHRCIDGGVASKDLDQSLKILIYRFITSFHGHFHQEHKVYGNTVER